MPRSSSPYLFEQITGEIIFSHSTASICQSIIMPKMEHQSRRFSSNTDETKLVFNCTKQLLMIDQHPSNRFEQLEADLFFRFRFNETLSLNIPSTLKNELFIIGKCQVPVYTEKEKNIDKVLSNDFKLTDTIFPDQSPATIDDDAQSWNNEQSNIIHHRYCLFESTLRVENVIGKLLQLERLLAFFTARHLLRLTKCNRFLSKKIFPLDLHELIESIRSNDFEKITNRNISTLTCITLSCIGFAGFSMPMNLETDIIKLLNDANIAQENHVQCQFHFLNTMFKTGRLLFYHVNDTEKGWRQSVLTSMALLSERISTLEIQQNCIQVNLNSVLAKTDDQLKSIGKIQQSLNNIAKNKYSNHDIEKKMDVNKEEINNKINNLQGTINIKIDGMQESTSAELKNIIKLMTLNEKKRSAWCSCILL